MDTATLQWRLATPVDEPLLIPMIRRFYAEDATPFDSLRSLPALRTLLADPTSGEVLLWLTSQGEHVGYAVLTLCCSLELGRTLCIAG